MELPPKPVEGDIVRFLGRTFVYMGMIDPLACLATDDPEPLLVYCRPEDLRRIDD